MNRNIFIYGVPGSGKTYFSKKLGKQLHLPVIEGDKIKDRAKYHLGTCQAWEQFVEFSDENVLKGLRVVRDALANYVIDEIADKNDFILEAAFLDPNKLKKLGRVVLLVTRDEEQHKKQFLHHREKMLDLSGHEFKAARVIQEFLINEAKQLEIEVIDNDGINITLPQ